MNTTFPGICVCAHANPNEHAWKYSYWVKGKIINERDTQPANNRLGFLTLPMEMWAMKFLLTMRRKYLGGPYGEGDSGILLSLLDVHQGLPTWKQVEYHQGLQCYIFLVRTCIFCSDACILWRRHLGANKKLVCLASAGNIGLVKHTFDRQTLAIWSS